MGNNKSAQSKSKNDSLFELEALPFKVLMTRFYSAFSSNQWDRRHQMIGSALCVHAVSDAARSKSLQHTCTINSGKVSRGDVMNWISDSKKYKEWVKLMLTKMELKSFQGSIGKALVRAGYERYGATGRQVRWKLPQNLVNEPYSGDEEEEVAEDNNDIMDNKIEKEDINAGLINSSDTKALQQPPQLPNKIIGNHEVI